MLRSYLPSSKLPKVWAVSRSISFVSLVRNSAELCTWDMAQFSLSQCMILSLLIEQWQSRVVQILLHQITLSSLGSQGSTNENPAENWAFRSTGTRSFKWQYVGVVAVGPPEASGGLFSIKSMSKDLVFWWSKELKRIYANLTQFSHVWNPISTPSIASTRLRNRTAQYRLPEPYCSAGVITNFRILLCKNSHQLLFKNWEFLNGLCYLSPHIYTLYSSNDILPLCSQQIFILSFLQYILCNLHKCVTKFQNSVTLYTNTFSKHMA